MTNAIEKLIADGLWRDISLLPRDESKDVYVFILGEDIDVDSYKTGWFDVKSDRWLLNGQEEYPHDDLRGLNDGVFMKVTQRPANALKVAVEALKGISMANIEVVDEIADEAIAEINRIAEGE
jgi:hypothetical protein